MAGSRVEIGGKVEYYCRTGYVVVGTSGATCKNTGKFSSPTPTCILKTAGVLLIIFFDYTVTEINLYLVTCTVGKGPDTGGATPVAGTIVAVGSTVQYFCRAGHIVKGFNSSTCLDNGTFSSPMPTCIIRKLHNISHDM